MNHFLSFETFDEQRADALEKSKLQSSASNASARGEEFGCKHLRKLNKIFVVIWSERKKLVSEQTSN